MCFNDNYTQHKRIPLYHSIDDLNIEIQEQSVCYSLLSQTNELRKQENFIVTSETTNIYLFIQINRNFSMFIVYAFNNYLPNSIGRLYFVLYFILYVEL